MASICVFCCAPMKSDNCEEGKESNSEETLKTFLKVIHSHFGINLTNNNGEQQDEIILDKACIKCEQSLKSICQLHSELESIRLKMEWTFGKLIRKMETVGRTPSKVKWLRRNQQANEFQRMTIFRNNFIAKCNQSLFKSNPAVILHRTKEDQSGDEFPTKPIERSNEEPRVQDILMNSDDNLSDNDALDSNHHQDSPAQNDPRAVSPSPVINDEAKPPLKKHISCPRCPTKFSHRRYYLRHQIKFHKNLPKIPPLLTTNAKPFQKAKEPEEIPKFIPCQICQVSLSNRKDILKVHFDVHHSTEDIDPQTVQKCDYPNCSAYFRTLLQINRHKRDIHGEDQKSAKTTCPICGRVCTEHGNLKTHMKTQHNDESPDLPLACDAPQCPKRFPNEDILKWHRMYYYHHNRTKSYESRNCPECNKECRGVSALKKHMKRHQQPEAPYVCELCGAAFKKKSILQQHGFFHKGPDNWTFQCEECGKKCATKHQLKDHMNVHLDVKFYSCKACGKGYKCRQKLRQHVNKFHAHEGLQDLPRKKTKPKFISRRSATQPE